MERDTQFTFDSFPTEDTQLSILMSKVKELYEKLAEQMHENQNLSLQNHQLQLKIASLDTQPPPSNPLHLFTDNNQTLFNLFIEKISTLETENKRLKELSQISNQPSHQTSNYSSQYSKRNSCTLKPTSPTYSISCLSTHDENREMYSPRVSHLGESKKTLRKTNIDKLWLSPSRKNLERIIHSQKSTQ